MKCVIVWCIIIAAFFIGGCADESGVSNRELLDFYERVETQQSQLKNRVDDLDKIIDHRVGDLEKRVKQVEETDKHNFSAYETIGRLTDRVANIEKAKCVRRPDWWCCGQLRDGEPSIDPEWIGLYPVKDKAENDAPALQSDAPAPPADVQSL